MPKVFSLGGRVGRGLNLKPAVLFPQQENCQKSSSVPPDKDDVWFDGVTAQSDNIKAAS